MVVGQDANADHVTHISQRNHDQCYAKPHGRLPAPLDHAQSFLLGVVVADQKERNDRQPDANRNENLAG